MKTPQWMIDAAWKFPVPHDPELSVAEIIELCKMLDTDRLREHLVELQKKAYLKGIKER